MTQTERLIAALRRRPHTYMQMIAIGASTCPWRRVAEAMESRPELEIVKGTNRRGLTTWAVVEVRKVPGGADDWF